MTKQDYMHLPKERLAELLAERDSLEETIEERIAEKFAELFGKLPMQPYPYQPNLNRPNPFQPISVLYGCPADFPDITYGTKTQQDND